MVVFTKLVDIIVGLVVLLVALNIVVTPLAKDRMDTFFSPSNQVGEYLNSTEENFEVYNPEEHYDVAGLSIMDLINSINILSGDVRSYVERVLELHEVTSAFGDSNYHAKNAMTNQARNEMNNFYTSQNQLIQEKGLFGKRLESYEEFKNYLCQYVFHNSDFKLNSFVYFAKDSVSSNAEQVDCGNGYSLFLIVNNNFDSNAASYLNHLSDDTKKVILVPEEFFGGSAALSYRFSYGMSSSDLERINEDVSTLDRTYGGAKGFFIGVGNFFSGIGRALFSSPDPNYWTVAPWPYTVYKETESVGCTQFKKDFLRDCYVVNFELPDPVEDASDPIDYLRSKAEAYRSPSYVLYYESLADGQEDAWGYSTATNVMKNMLIGGITNAVFDVFQLGGEAVKFARGALAKKMLGNAAESKAVSTASKEIIEEAAERLGAEAIEEGAQIIARELTEDLLKEGEERILQNARKLYMLEAIQEQKYLKNLDSGELSVLSQKMDDGIDFSTVTGDDLKDLVRESDPSYWTKSRRDSLAGNLRRIGSETPNDLDKLIDVLAFKRNAKYMISKLDSTSAQKFVNDFKSKYLDNIKKSLDNLDDLNPKILENLQARAAADTDVFFNQLNIEDFTDLTLLSKNLDDSVSQNLIEALQKELSEDTNLMNKFNKFVLRSRGRQLTITSLLIYWDWANNARMEKYYPSGRNAFVLFDPSLPDKLSRKRIIEIDDPISTYVNLNKNQDSRFYLASPCKADLLVSTKFCTCNVRSGSLMIKQGDIYRPVQNIATEDGEIKEVHLWDSISESEQEEVLSSFSDFWQGFDYEISAEKEYYEPLLQSEDVKRKYYNAILSVLEKSHDDSDKGLSYYFSKFVDLSGDKQKYLDAEIKPNSPDNLCYGSFQSPPTASLQFIGDYNTYSRLQLAGLDSKLVYYSLYDTTLGAPDGALMADSGSSIIELREKIYGEDIYPNNNFLFFSLFKADASSEQFCLRDPDELTYEEFEEIFDLFAQSYLNHPDYMSGFKNMLDALFYDVVGDETCEAQEREKCSQLSSTSSIVYCLQNIKSNCRQRWVNREMLAREWYTNYLYVDYKDLDDSDIKDMVQYCDSSNIASSDSIDDPYAGIISPDARFSFRQDNSDGFYSWNFLVTIPCVDVRTNNLNFNDYNNGNNFCHLGVPVEEAKLKKEIVSGVISIGEIAATVAISIVAPPAGAGAVVAMAAQPVISFGTGAASAWIADVIDKSVTWPHNQKTTWFDEYD